jgi:PKD repeat protein
MLDSWIAGGGVHCHTNDQPAASTIGTAPIADFSVVSTAGSTPYEAHFSDLSKNDPTVWKWDFGDGEMANDQSPIHTYTGDGDYTVTLTAASASGSSRLVRTDYISVPEPGTVLQPLLQLGLGGLGLWGLNALGVKRRDRRRQVREASGIAP